jgi:RNA polymerase sigma-70 factor, ECF subfamily
MNATLEQPMSVPLANRRTSDVDTRRADLRAELERHHPACVGWARSCCKWDKSEADDVLQTTYLKILDGRAEYRAQSGFKTWLFAVIRRTAAEQRRRQMVRRLLLAKVELPAADDVLGSPAERDGNAELLKALDVLPRRQREVLHLVFYEDMRIEDAAEIVGVSVGTARTHYERGKARLRQLLSLDGR